MQLPEVLASWHGGQRRGFAFPVSSQTRISDNGMDLKCFRSLSF
jgi:hypothetical protein